MAAMVFLAFALAFASNTLRSGRLPWSGSAPEELRWPDLDWIAPETAASYQNSPETMFLDARSTRDFNKRHIAMSVSFPADDIENAYAELRDFFRKDMRFIIYANEPNLSARVHRFLDQRGYKAQILEGGWDAWERKRLPVEVGR